MRRAKSESGALNNTDSRCEGLTVPRWSMLRARRSRLSARKLASRAGRDAASVATGPLTFFNSPFFSLVSLISPL